MSYPTTSSASDVWSLRDVYKAEASGDWPGVLSDPNFANVSLLINADGLGDGSTAIVDASTNNLAITVNGNAQVDTAIKKYGTGSVKFDGNGDFLKLAPTPLFNFGTGNFTLEFWVYRAGNGSTSINRIIQFEDGDIVSPILFSESSGSIHLWMSALAGSWSIAQNVTIGSLTTAWTHVALVRNGTSIVAYVNGTSAYSTTSSASLLDASDCVIAGQSAGRYFNGYIDDLRITKGVARYTTGFTPPTQALPTS